MRKVGIITFLHNDNFGSALQAFALQAVIGDIGYDAEHIDYHPDSKEKIRNMISNGNSPGLLVDGLRKRSVKSCQKGAQQKAASFPAFYAGRMKISPVCTSATALREMARRYEILVCGSDQIWSPVWLNPSYFLNFASEGQRKVAYAASLGVAKLPGLRKRKRIRRLLSGFDAISVREAAGAKLIKEIAGIEPDIMPDPVCLLKKEAWLHLAEEQNFENPTIVCYFIGESAEYWKKVAELRKQTAYDVVVIPVTAASYYSGYPLLDGLSPEQFLGCLAAAAIVCTDSFHGTALSVILEKPFRLFRRYRDDDPESKNSRLDHLLSVLDIDPAKGVTDASAVNARLEHLRIEGRNWLENHLS